MGQYIKINVPVAEGGVVEAGTNIAGFPSGGTPYTSGTASRVSFDAGDFTVTGDGDWAGTFLDVLITGGVIVSITMTGHDVNNVKSSDVCTINVPAAFTGGSEWSGAITTTVNRIVLESGIHYINMNHFVGCYDLSGDDDSEVRVFMNEAGVLASYLLFLSDVAVTGDKYQFIQDFNILF